MKEGNYVAEFGCSMPVNWLGESQVTMSDSDGKQIFCKCGKPATSGLIGTSAYLAQCSECFNKS